MALAVSGVAFAQAPAVSPEKAAKNQQTEPLVATAKLHLDKSEWDAAIAAADKALAADASCAPAMLARGDALYGKGEYDPAIEQFDKLTALPGRDTEAVKVRAEAFAHRAESLYRKRDYLKAIDSAYFAVLEKGDHVDAHTIRGQAYLERLEYDKAINSANRAIGVKAEDPQTQAEAYSIRGHAYAAKGNFDQSIADQKKALELDPQLAIAYQRRGAALSAKGDKQGAYTDLEQALKLKPDLAEALCDRAYLFSSTRDKTKAMADLNEAVKLQPTSARAHYSLALALLDAEETDKAIASFDEAIKLNPKLAPAFCFRGYAHQAKNAHGLAEKDFSEAIKLDPKFLKAYQGRIVSYRKLAKPTEANADNAKVRELTAKPVKGPKKDAELPPRFIAKAKPVDPKRATDAAKSAKEIDRLIAINYEKHKVQPNPKTTDEQFVRRIYLDITGTIPTYPQIKRFIAAKEPNKRALLIDELLSGDGYTGHFYNFWVDVLRYTDTLNGEVRGEPYRQWIKQSLAEDKPWDKMVYEMLAAEGLVWKNPATGYLQRDSGMPLDNMNNTVRIFLGTRIGCAQCHDHPFDRWTQKEFYEMAAFTFGTATRTGGGDVRYWKENPNDRLMSEFSEYEQEEEDRRNRYYGYQRMIGFNQMIVNDHPEQKIRLPKNYQYTNAKPEEVIEPKALFGEAAPIAAGEAPRQAFAKWTTSPKNPRFALTVANRLWKQVFGVGQIEPVDDMMDSTTAENPELMTHLEGEMKRLNFSMKEYLRILYNTEAYQRQACFDEVPMGEPYHFVGPILRRMTAEQAWDSILTLAVVDPNEYRELPAHLRTDALGVDLEKVKAIELMEAEQKANAVDGGQYERQKKYIYQGTLLARASELPSPVPPNHFLRMFGQSDRELISSSSTSGSVPQVLFMFNGPISHMMLEKDTTIYNTVKGKDDPGAGVRAIFLTILSREPDPEELALGVQEVKTSGKSGYGNVIWSLVNTREFLFVQ